MRIRTPETTIAAATTSATIGSIQSAPVTCTSARPTRTPTDVSASVRRCAASPSSAADSVVRARRATIPPTVRLATADRPTTAMPTPSRWTSVPTTRWRIASNAMTAEPTRMSIPSIAAERFSIFSWP